MVRFKSETIRCVSFLFLVLFGLWATSVPSFCGTSPKSMHKKHTIVVIRYRISPNYFRTVVKGLKQGLGERGYRIGENLELIDILTPTADERSIPVVLDAVKNYLGRADLFVTCGWISMYAREILKHTQVPQFFCPVLKSVALKMLPSVKAPPRTNLSGIYLMYPPEKLLRIARLILPTAKRYGYVYDSRIPADMVFKNAFSTLDEHNRHGFEVAFLDLKQGAQYVVQEMKERRIEVYGGIVGAFKKRGELSRAHIPMITALTLDIEKEDIPNYLKGCNIIAGLFNPFSYCGRQVGLMAADIFDGRRTIYETVPRPALQIAFVNMRAARRLGIYIPFMALEAVDLVVK